MIPFTLCIDYCALAFAPPNAVPQFRNSKVFRFDKKSIKLTSADAKFEVLVLLLSDIIIDNDR